MFSLKTYMHKHRVSGEENEKCLAFLTSLTAATADLDCRLFKNAKEGIS